MDTSINQKFANILVSPPIFFEVLIDKLSNSYSRDLYIQFRMNFAADPVNIPAPQFVCLGISTINALDKSASLWTPATIVERPTDVAHGSGQDHISGKVATARVKVSANLDYSYKTDFKIWREIRTLITKRMQGATNFGLDSCW